MLAANNPMVRRWLLTVIGIGAAVDTALQVTKEMIPLPFGKSRFRFLLGRLLGYGVVAWAVWLLKPKPSYDPAHYRQEVETIAEQWLRASISVVAVLMYRSRLGNTVSPETAQVEKELNKTTKSITRLAEITAKITRCPVDDRDDLFSELVQMFKNFGFEIPDAVTEDESVFIWEESSGEHFNLFGNAEPGDRVRIEKHPVIQNGTIVKKGLVRKIRT